MHSEKNTFDKTQIDRVIKTVRNAKTVTLSQDLNRVVEKLDKNVSKFSKSSCVDEDILRDLTMIADSLVSNQYIFDPVFDIYSPGEIINMVDIVLETLSNIDMASDEIQRKRALELASKTLHKIIDQGNWWLKEVGEDDLQQKEQSNISEVESTQTKVDVIGKKLAAYAVQLLSEENS